MLDQPISENNMDKSKSLKDVYRDHIKDAKLCAMVADAQQQVIATSNSIGAIRNEGNRMVDLQTRFNELTEMFTYHKKLMTCFVMDLVDKRQYFRLTEMLESEDVEAVEMGKKIIISKHSQLNS